MFKKLFKEDKVAKKITSKLKLNPLKSDKEKSISRQQYLMDQFFYDILKSLARRECGNAYSITFKGDGHRPVFTARGAFVHRTDMNEKLLLNITQYSGGDNIITSSLTYLDKDNDRLHLREAMFAKFEEYSNRNLDIEFIERADHEELQELTYLERLWRIYIETSFLMFMYLYDHRDLTYTVERFYRALFKAIAFAESSKHEPEFFGDELFEVAQDLLFPLSLNGFNALRNAMPKEIASRMSTVKFKLKTINQDRYDSPYDIAQAKRVSKQ